MATLHKKTLGIIGATILGMIFIIYLSSHFIIIESFDKLEERDARKNADCLKNILLSQAHDLEKKASDWSVWDETYMFVQENSSEFAEKYLTSETFYNQRLDFMLFYDEEGEQVYKKTVIADMINEGPVTELEKHLKETASLLEHSSESSKKTGFLIFKGKPILISSQPVVRSDKSGPVAGTVLMGRIIDDDEIKRLQGITGQRISVKDLSDHKENNSTADPFAHNIDQQYENTIISTSTDNTYIFSYLHFNDIYGKDAFALETATLRDIHQHGINTINYFLIFLILTGIIFGTSATILLERSHISRLKILRDEVRNIGEKGDFSKRVPYEGDDEVAGLGESINSMLESLERSQDLIMKRDTTINAILQAMPDMMFRIKKDGTICNYKLSTDKCLYESPETELNINLEDVLPAHIATMELKVIEQALRTNKIQTMQYTMPVKGEMRDFEVRVVVCGEDEVMAVIKDITEIKQAEEMRRKDLLLKEIHHRVKNNLQIISSLLRLQSRKFTDEETIEAFRESQNRAKMMAIAHEKLYQSRDLENIELENYVSTLSNYLLNTYGCEPEDIKIDINIKNVILSIDTAIPLGLILNEMVSNALKHAFKNHKGKIQIEMRPEDNGLYALTIRDNGIGFPEDIDFTNTESLGMQIVVSLVEQIEGRIELKRDNGTEFKIMFKELSYKRRDY
jgi:two-component sensor histidine kinase/sensor domain CHASE-containing protein